METKINENVRSNEFELIVEELEQVVALGMQLGNHNEAFMPDAPVDSTVEELEEVVAPGREFNHNETVVRNDELQLETEDLEEVVAPGGSFQHNETGIFDGEIGRRAM